MCLYRSPDNPCTVLSRRKLVVFAKKASYSLWSILKQYHVHGVDQLEFPMYIKKYIHIKELRVPTVEIWIDSPRASRKGRRY